MRRRDQNYLCMKFIPDHVLSFLLYSFCYGARKILDYDLPQVLSMIYGLLDFKIQ